MTQDPMNKQNYDTTELDKAINASPIYGIHETGKYPEAPRKMTGFVSYAEMEELKTNIGQVLHDAMDLFFGYVIDSDKNRDN